MRENRMSTLLAAGGLATTAMAQGPLSEPFPATINLTDLDGALGFVMHGVAASDQAGYAVGRAGDINGDGLPDIAVGAWLADPNGSLQAGETYVVFGRRDPSPHFPARLELASLDGAIGFRLPGFIGGGRSGFAVRSAGDINNDRIDDLAIGAPTLEASGQVYVVYGTRTGFAAQVPLDSLNGANGFRLDGDDPSGRLGAAIGRSGDVDGDGLDDLLIGAPGDRDRGEAFVVYGRREAFPAVVDLDDVQGTLASAIIGDSIASDNVGAGMASIDFDGNGLDDLVVGAPTAETGFRNGGATYVLYGQLDRFPARQSLSLILPRTRFRGAETADRVGTAIDNAGDVNNDGIDDLIIGAPFSAGTQGRGRAYVVFGTADGLEPFGWNDLFDDTGEFGFRIEGVDTGDGCGTSVSAAGDVNGDGVDDLIVGAPSIGDVGKAYVVFGREDGTFPPVLRLRELDGQNGFRLLGIGNNDQTGISVAGIGDINGDGADDIAIGSPLTDPDGRTRAGMVSIVYGRALFPTCPADLDRDGEATLFDYLAFLTAFESGDLIADFTGDGTLTLADFLAFQNAFDMGC